MTGSPSLQVEVVAAGGATGGAYALLDIRAPIGATLPPHVASREDGLLFVLTGELEVVVGGSARRRLAAGEQIALPRTRPRRLTVLQDARLLVLLVPAGGEALADLARPPAPERDDVAALLAAAGVALLPPGWGRAVAG